uniref:TIR domain-containing protein n=1 Tax=Candidatus Kentrum sp. TUN TaxID=2126343 RepID=A0A451A0P0_9GAMM|nr:MAG: TIR domain-containing protein [Candidatus Kentron sp. TUN]VFK59592.1 MAG: TIR domain-containing protein [Candidatus Kentron sp. TUN]
MKFKVFISYSTHDLKQIELLREQIARTPIEVFIARDSIPPSQELTSRIKSEIQECDLFIVLWSRNAKDSEWISQEIGQASAYDKTILPLVLDEELEPPGFISGLKCLPIFEDLETALTKAEEIVMMEYDKKLTREKKALMAKEKDRKFLMGMGLGALFLWAINQK